MATCVLSASAQTLPGAPETNGLISKTATFYVNGTNSVNSGGTSALGVTIANNGNVVVCWQDDADVSGDYIKYIGAGWTMFDADGNSITTNARIDSAVFGWSVTNNIRNFFRPDGSPTPPYTGWGPKLHANLFGAGFGLGDTATFALPFEIPSPYIAYFVGSPAPETFSGGFPAVQLVSSDGIPQGNMAGVSAAYANDTLLQEIRMGDWEYLANGNIVIVGESRQADDLVNLYSGAAAGTHIIYRILTPAGAEVKAADLVSDTPVPGEMWHGAGATKDGFAVRFSDSTRGVCVRMFDNNGTPTTTNLPLATLTGYAQAAGGGRGDSVGFHGNGVDAYVIACNYSVDGTNGFWVTVLNTNGTVRWTRDVSDDLVVTGVERGDAAINELGEVVVVYSASPGDFLLSGIIGRRFDAAGNPVGGSFYVGENELPDRAANASRNARAAWRNGQIAIIWESTTYPDLSLDGIRKVALRYFLATPPNLSISRSGNSVTISWPPGVAGVTLESSSSVAPGSIWNPVAGVVNNSVTVVNPTDNRFYRLKRQ